MKIEDTNKIHVGQFLTYFQDQYLSFESGKTSSNCKVKNGDSSTQVADVYGILDDNDVDKYDLKKDVISGNIIRSALADRAQYNFYLDLVSSKNEENFKGKPKIQSEGLKYYQQHLIKSIQKDWRKREHNLDIQQLLQTFEVWSTKALASQILTSPQHSHSNLLSFPPAHLVKSFLSEESLSSEKERHVLLDQNYPQLLVSPNALTWREFLRISIMVSALPTPELIEKASNSPLCESPPLLSTPKKESHKSTTSSLLLAENSIITTPDLVALWVRAQRNGGAFRHLLHLFSFTKNEIEDTESSQDKEHAHNENGYMNKKYEYTVKYVGNSSKTRSKVIVEANTLDAIVEWVVTNHVLANFEQSYKYLSSDPDTPEKIARNVGKRGLDNSYQEGDHINKTTQHHSLSKRTKIKSSAVQPIILADEATLSRRSFILRWFCRRNRKFLSIVFASQLHEDIEIYDIGFDKNVDEKKIWEEMQSLIKNYTRNSGTTDRTFSRIDRRIFTKYKTHEEFSTAVITLLNGLVEYTTDKELLKGVQNAIVDFTLLCKHYLEKNNFVPLLSLKPSQEADTNTQLLATLPPPWIDQCFVCRNTVQTQCKKTLCQCCGNVFHTECCGTISSQSFHEKKPSAPENNTWGKKIEVVIRRTERNHGPISWGLKLQPSENFANEIALMFAGSWSNDFRKNSSSIYNDLMHAGLVVTDVVDSTEEGGLRRGDLITRIIDCNSKTEYELGSMDKRDEIFYVETYTRFFVIAHRPPKPFFTFLNRPSNIQYCMNCTSISNEVQDKRKEDIATEAARCRAVIRRLGMEWSSIPFHDENWENQDNGQTTYVSLRRLDLMMTYIIADNTKISDADHDQNTPMPLLGPFLEPNHYKANDKESINGQDRHHLIDNMSKRVSWAPNGIELRPTELLCIGMRLILSYKEESNKEERTDLTHRFLRLLRSWCFDTAPNMPPTSSEQFKKTINLPKQALYFTAPWIHQACQVCGVKKQSKALETKTEDESNYFHICNDSFCENMAKKMNEPEKLDESELQKGICDNQSPIHKYKVWSSFVGSIMLVIPGDPLHLKISSIINLSIEHLDRVIEILVMSFSPSDHGGIFEVIPILSKVQIFNTLEYCKTHGLFNLHENKSRSSNSGRYRGIVKFTHTELEYCIRETVAVRTALDQAVHKFSSSLTLGDGSEILSSDNSYHDKTVVTYSPDGDWTNIPHLASLHSLAHPDDHKADGHNDMRYFDELKRKQGILVDGDSLKEDGSSQCVQSVKISANDVSLLISDKCIQEYVALIDAMCHSQCEFVRDFIKEVSSSRKKVLPEMIEDKRVFMQYPDHDTDIGESDEDIKIITFNKRKRNKRAVPDLLDEGFSDDDDHAASIKNQLSSNHNKIGYHLCYTDFLFDEILPPYQQLPELQQTRTSIISETKKLFIILGREIQCKNLSCESHTSGDTNKDLDKDDEKKDKAKEGENETSIIGQSSSIDSVGYGWGLELLRWRTEKKNLRVGRVAPNSPAGKANLQPHDIVISINGKTVEHIGQDTELANAMLWNHYTIDPPKVFPSEISINPGLNLLKRLSGPVTGPVILEIQRISQSPLPPRDSTAYTPTKSLERMSSTKNAKENETSEQRNSNVEPILEKESMETRSFSPYGFDMGNTLEISNQLRSVERPLLHPEELYASGFKGSILTCAETVVLIDALSLNQPGLGLRLLTPRYDAKMIQNEFNKMIGPHLRQNLHLIPKLHKEDWKRVVEADYRRSLLEKGPISFQELGFSYRTPTQILPIDRILEISMRQDKARDLANSQKMDRNNILALSRVATDSLMIKGSKRDNKNDSQTSIQRRGPSQDTKKDGTIEIDSDDDNPSVSETLISPQRIRGGGFELEDASYQNANGQGRVQNKNVFPIVMSNIAPSKWANLPVFSRCITTKNSVETGEAKLIGVALREAPLFPPQHVTIKVIYVSNVGYLSRHVDQTIASKIVFTVAENSDEYNIIMKRPKLQNNPDIKISLIPPEELIQAVDLTSSIENEHDDDDDEDDDDDDVIEVHNVPTGVNRNQNMASPTNATYGVEDSNSFSANPPPTFQPQGIQRSWNSVNPPLVRKATVPNPMNVLTVQTQQISESAKSVKPPFTQADVSIAKSLNSIPVTGKTVNSSLTTKATVLTTNSPNSPSLNSLTIQTKQIKGPKKTKITPSVKEVTASNKTSPPLRSSVSQQPTPETTPTPTPKGDPVVIYAARSLLDRLFHRHNSATPIGFLPDGRGVCWFPNDPKAVYIRTPQYFFGEENPIGWAFIEEVQRKYRLLVRYKKKGSSLHSCIRGQYCCVWGCTEVKRLEDSNKKTSERKILSFSTKEEFFSHIIQFHCYESNDAPIHKNDFFPGSKKERWIRITEGKMMQCLLADLTAAICARSPVLLKVTVPFEEPSFNWLDNVLPLFTLSPIQHRIMFKVSNIVKYVNGAQGSNYFTKVKHSDHMKSYQSRSLLRLWSRLARLFAAELDGGFRFEGIPLPITIHPCMYSRKNLLSSDITQCARENDLLHNFLLDRETKKLKHKYNRNENATNALDINEKKLFQYFYPCRSQKLISEKLIRRGCSICTTPTPVCSEKVSNTSDNISLDSKDAEKASSSSDKISNTRTTSIGCALMTEEFSIQHSVPLNDIIAKTIGSLLPIREKIDSYRILLLKVAGRIPPTLYKKDSSIVEPKSGEKLYLWNKVRLESWLAFVQRASNGRMITQALIVLLSSIKTFKLPRWWRAARSGWESALGSMTNPSLHSIAIRLFTFDAALAEYLAFSRGAGEKSKSSNPGSSRKASKETNVQNNNNISQYGYIPLEALLKMELSERMQHVLKWAEHFSLERFDGESNDECCVCDAGGDLMCCEFCSNVQHVECCKPPLSKFPDFDWVCDLCVADIVDLWKN